MKEQRKNLKQLKLNNEDFTLELIFLQDIKAVVYDNLNKFLDLDIPFYFNGRNNGGKSFLVNTLIGTFFLSLFLNIFRR